MRQVFKFLLTVLISLALSPIAHAALKGGLEYEIPIDYTKLNQEELEAKAGFYYNLALKTASGKINEEMTAALNLYTILNNKCPDNLLYAVRLGVLQDLCGMDKYAKSNFYKAMGIDPSSPEPYFRLGEFCYRRNLYKKALRMYREAYKRGYTRHYETAYKLGDIYEKFGDTEAALKYLKLASGLSPNSLLDSKIRRVEAVHNSNREYYSNTRIHLIER